LLFDAGAEINPEPDWGYDTPFKYILAQDNIDLVRYFIEAGANIYIKDIHGRTPIENAAIYVKDPEILRLLVSKGASVTTGEMGNTPLHIVAGDFRRPHLIPVLISLGADVNARDHNGFTPLMMAASFYENVEILINAGANINAQNNEGKTALMLSAQYGVYPDVIRLFLEKGADAKLEDNTGRTALDWLDMNQRLSRDPVRRELRDAGR
jgi:ankyrin repeat protein